MYAHILNLFKANNNYLRFNVTGFTNYEYFSKFATNESELEDLFEVSLDVIHEWQEIEIEKENGEIVFRVENKYESDVE